MHPSAFPPLTLRPWLAALHGEHRLVSSDRCDLAFRWPNFLLSFSCLSFDLTSLRRLLQVSPNFRNLFLLYPESCLQQVLEQLPRPVHGYVRTSWALHNLEHTDFDATTILDLLRSIDFTDALFKNSHVFAHNKDPLEVLDAMADLYKEVETAVESCAQSVHATMETFVTHGFRSPPLSSGRPNIFDLECSVHVEGLRSALSKFSHHGKSCKFQQTFMASLPPWQVKQIVSLEHLLVNVAQGKFYSITDRKGSLWEKLSRESVYFRSFSQALG